jgi:hypothetical protein
VKRARFYSVNVMRGRHPAWFKEDLERLFGLLATGAIRPRVAGRISFDQVPEAHRRLEAGGLEGKLVLCPDLPSRGDRVLPGACVSPSLSKAAVLMAPSPGACSIAYCSSRTSRSSASVAPAQAR